MEPYHVRKPPHGRVVIPPRSPSGPNVITPGAPTAPVHNDFTPIPVDPPMVQHPDGNAQLDVNETLRLLYKNSVRTSQSAAASSHGMIVDFDAIEKKLSRASKFGSLIAGVSGIIGAIFGAGILVATLRKEIATNSDVRAAIIEHNEVDPATRDPVTLQEAGSHPVFRRRIDETNTQIGEHAREIDRLGKEQRKIDLRNEYQFEFARWQARTSECERTKKCKAPAKPERLDQLERTLMLGLEP